MNFHHEKAKLFEYPYSAFLACRVCNTYKKDYIIKFYYGSDTSMKFELRYNKETFIKSYKYRLDPEC